MEDTINCKGGKTRPPSWFKSREKRHKRRAEERLLQKTATKTLKQMDKELLDEMGAEEPVTEVTVIDIEDTAPVRELESGEEKLDEMGTEEPVAEVTVIDIEETAPVRELESGEEKRRRFREAEIKFMQCAEWDQCFEREMYVMFN